MSDCLEIRPMLVALMDGELDPSQQNLVRLHLEGCAECRSVNNDYLNIGRLKAPSEMRDTDDIWNRVENEIRRTSTSVETIQELRALRSEVALLREEVAALRQHLRPGIAHTERRGIRLGSLDRQPASTQQFRLV